MHTLAYAGDDMREVLKTAAPARLPRLESCLCHLINDHVTVVNYFISLPR